MVQHDQVTINEIEGATRRETGWVHQGQVIQGLASPTEKCGGYLEGVEATEEF